MSNAYSMFFRLCLVASLNVGGLSIPTDTSQGSGDGEYPLVKLLDQFAQNDVEHYLSLFDDYKDFVPEEYHKILSELGQLINITYHEEPWIFNHFYSTLRDLSLHISEKALDNMADAYDELTSGRRSFPSTLLGITGYIREKNPELFERVHALLILSLQKFDQLQPETKLALAKCYNYVSETLSDPSKVSAEQIAALISNLKSLYDNSSDNIKQDIRNQWPDAYNLLESRFAANIAKMADNYANNGIPDNYKASPKIGYMPKCCE